MQSQIPKHWYLFSSFHTQYLYLIPCCTCCCNVTYFCIYNLYPTKCITMFPSTSCRNPLCPIPRKVLTNHAAYSHHRNCSTGCLHFIQTGWSATANQCHPPSSHVVTTSTKSPALLHSQFVNGNTTFGAEPKRPSSATDGIYSSKVETTRTDDDFQGKLQAKNGAVNFAHTHDHVSLVFAKTSPRYEAIPDTTRKTVVVFLKFEGNGEPCPSVSPSKSITTFHLNLKGYVFASQI
jgi:hypothetical protein